MGPPLILIVETVQQMLCHREICGEFIESINIIEAFANGIWN